MSDSTVVLRDYQVAATEAIKEGWVSGKYPRQMLVLATGLGKTHCIASLARWGIQQYGYRPILILAHREELLDQITEHLRLWLGCEALIGREQGQSFASTMDNVVVASVATLGRPDETKIDGLSERLTRFPRDHFSMIQIDEAHHSSKSNVTYQNILKYFNKSLLLGVTATPKRAREEDLHGVFDRIAYRMDIVDGTKTGYLAPITAHRVRSETTLSGLRTTAGDYNLKDLSDRVNNTARNSLVVQTYLTKCNGERCVVYATTVEHARLLSEELASNGVRSRVISGDMRKDDRKEFLSGFVNDEIDVLCNYGVLTEGVNFPFLKHIISARPTKSLLLITQIAGRLTRVIDGKDSANFYEIVDLHSGDTATAAEIFDFKKTFDPQGNDFLSCIRLGEEMEAGKPYFDPWIWGSVQEMRKRFILASADDPTGTGIKRQGNVGRTDCFDSRYRYYATIGGSYKLVHNDRQAGTKYVLRIDPDALGGYTASVIEIENNNPRAKFKFNEETISLAAKKLESCVLDNFRDWDILLNINAGWKQKAKTESASEKQLALIKKFHLAHGEKLRSLNKLEASDLLSRFFNK